jgi:hypothetical protein
LHWKDSELTFEKPEKEPLKFVAEIENTGGIELSFDILNLPEWLTAVPATGSIGPVSSKTIQFSIEPYIPIGDYSVDVNLLSGQGFNDKLIIDLHVFGVPPAWHFDAAAYAHTMSIVADLNILGELSEDSLDRVVAYINGEVRGLTTMEYIPELDRHIGFLEVYSNVTSGEQVSFKVWDASTGTTYAAVDLKNGAQQSLQIPYVANTLVGNVVTPARWIVKNDIIQEIPMNAGWTWISFNVLSQKFGDIDAFFAELSFENNDQILSQTRNASYNPSVNKWQGNLMNTGLELTKMYKCDFTHADILRVVGPRVNPAAHPISIVSGWNWIPYLAAERIEINEALNSFSATPGDLVKSQDQFSVYHPTLGWVGTLKSMEPGKGYMLFAASAGVIVYPLQAIQKPGAYLHEEHTMIKWRSGRDHQPLLHRARNMTMIARLESELRFDDPPLIAAFAGDLLLQLCVPVRLEGMDTWSYYFTLQGEATDHAIHFEVYTSGGKYTGLIEERITWDGDQMMGTLDQPFVLHLREPGQLLCTAQPNPFSDVLEILIEMPQAGSAELAVFDAKGSLVYAAKFPLLKPGLHRIVWDGKQPGGNPAVPGLYVLQVHVAGNIHYEKLVKQ